MTTPSGAMPMAKWRRGAAGSSPLTIHMQGLGPLAHATACWPACVTGKVSRRDIEGHDHSEGFQSMHGHLKAANANVSMVHLRIALASPVEDAHVCAVADRGNAEGRGPVR